MKLGFKAFSHNSFKLVKENYDYGFDFVELMAESTVAPITALIGWISTVILAIALTQPRPFDQRLKAAIALLLALAVSFTATSIAQHRAAEAYQQLELSLITSSLWLSALAVNPRAFIAGCLIGIITVVSLIVGVDCWERLLWVPMIDFVTRLRQRWEIAPLIALEFTLGLAYYTHKVIAYTLWPHPEPADPSSLMAES